MIQSIPTPVIAAALPFALLGLFILGAWIDQRFFK